MSLAKKISISLAVILVCGVIAAGLTFKAKLGHELIVNGVTVGEVNLSSKTKAEATTALKQLEQKIKGNQVEVVVEGQSFKASLGELGVGLNPAQMVEQAYAVGRSGSLLNQYKIRKMVASQGQEIGLKTNVDEKALDAKLSQLTSKLTIKPVDASLRITAADQVEIIPGKKGQKVNTQGASSQLKSIVEDKAEPTVKLAMMDTQPVQDEAAVKDMGIKGIVAQFTTHFDASQANRSYNITVAAEAMNGLAVKPGETVSFNNIVGPRSSAAGYREAPEIVNNKLVPGIGGGVCQVSTTLYNSLLKGDFEIVHRQPHSHPSAYVPVGRDATVTYGGIDFKFKNNRSTYLYIKSQINGSLLTFKLFGDPGQNKEIELIDRIEKVIPNQTVTVKDPNLALGKQVVKEKGYTGYRTTTVRLLKENGTVVKRDVIARSYYKPVNKVVAVGTGKPIQMRPAPVDTNTMNTQPTATSLPEPGSGTVDAVNN